MEKLRKINLKLFVEEKMEKVAEKNLKLFVEGDMEKSCGKLFSNEFLKSCGK